MKGSLILWARLLSILLNILDHI